MYEPTRKDGPPPEVRALVVSSIVNALKSLPPELQGRTDDEAARAFEDLALKWRDAFTDLGRDAFADLARILSDEIDEARDDHDAEQVIGAFARAFLEWYDQRQEGDDPTSPRTQDFVLAAFRRYLNGPEEINTKAVGVLRSRGVNPDILFYDNTKRRHEMDEADGWTREKYQLELDLTSDARKKLNGPEQDVIYVTTERRPTVNGFHLDYEFESDAQFCQDVMDAIGSVWFSKPDAEGWLAGRYSFNVLGVTRLVAGRRDVKNISRDLRRKVAEAIATLCATYCTITSENVTLKKRGRPWGYHEPLLVLGHDDDGNLYFLRKPVFVHFAEASGELVGIPVKYLEIMEIPENGEPVPWAVTRQRQHLCKYMLARIIRAHGYHAGALKYTARAETQTTPRRAKAKPRQAEAARKRIRTREVEFENLCHFRMDTLYKETRARSTDEKRRVERDALLILNSTKRFAPELLKDFILTTDRVKKDRHGSGRYRAVKSIKFTVGEVPLKKLAPPGQKQTPRAEM